MKPNFLIFLLAALSLVGAGCSNQSYPSERIKQSLTEICQKEYGIENVDVKVAGDTIAVYLPLSKLFAADFKEAAVTGKVRNLETLFEPSPEALEKVEDVLFSISRVILSTDHEFKFYVLEATDVEKTGMQLILTGCVNDIKRVRVWDISRNEYRKRVIHELKLNRSILWHKPVRRFLKDIGTLSVDKTRKKYFGNALTVEAIQNLFFNALPTEKPGEPKREWEILDIRSIPVQRNEVLVYTKVRSNLDDLHLGLTDLQYLFLLSLNEEEAHIVRIIPFQYKDEKGDMKRISFPKELQIEENLDKWEQEFPLVEVHTGDFLAQQLTRRVQGISAADERIQNTFRDVKLTFEYHEEKNSYFSLMLDANLRDFNHYNRKSLVFHEDMLYLLDLVSREFVDVLRSYQFGDYDYLKLNLTQEPNPWLLNRNDLELFRRKKIDLQGLLALPKNLI